MDNYLEKIKEIFTKKRKAYKDTFSTDSGKIVLADLYKLCKTDNLSYVENSPDKTAFNEGAKYVALYIRNTLKQRTEDIEKLLEEHSNKLKYNPLKKEELNARK